jgi:hypothetical protein
LSSEAGGIPIIKASDMGVPIIKTSSTHDVRTYKHLKFWAEGGRVQIVDEDTGDHKSWSVQHMWNVVDAFLKKEQAGRRVDFWSDDLRNYRRLIADTLDVIVQAKYQGDPHSARVLEEKLRAKGHRASVGFHKAYPGSMYQAPKVPELGGAFHGEIGKLGYVAGRQRRIIHPG